MCLLRIRARQWALDYTGQGGYAFRQSARESEIGLGVTPRVVTAREREIAWVMRSPFPRGALWGGNASSAMNRLSIEDARIPGDMAAMRKLFREYQQWLDVDLCFQGFEAEMAGLPGKYAPPAGAMLIVRDGKRVAAGVAMWPLDDGVCEMKRLYVRPPWRSRGLGRRLAETVIGRARGAGYARMRLDTLPQLTAAQALYRSMGFTDIGAYYHNPIAGVVYMEKVLTPP